MAALRESRFVWFATLVIVVITLSMFAVFALMDSNERISAPLDLISPSMAERIPFRSFTPPLAVLAVSDAIFMTEPIVWANSWTVA